MYFSTLAITSFNVVMIFREFYMDNKLVVVRKVSFIQVSCIVELHFSHCCGSQCTACALVYFAYSITVVLFMLTNERFLVNRKKKFGNLHLSDTPTLSKPLDYMLPSFTYTK